MQKRNRDYWIGLVEKLNGSDDWEGSVSGVLEELCDHFEFGAGFVYQADYTGAFFLRHQHQVYAGRHLKKMIRAVDVLGLDLAGELVSGGAVYYRQSSEKDALSRAVGEMFEADSLVLAPVADEDKKLIALVGLIDRRGESRRADDDLEFVSAVLGTLGTYIKMTFYKQRAEAAYNSLKSVLDNMGIDVYVNDFETHEILYLNRSMAAPYGGVENMLGRKCWEALYEGKTEECNFCPEKKLIDEEGKPTKLYSWDYKRPFDGSWFRVLSAAFPWVDGRLAHVVSSVDITENKTNEEIVRKIAEFDYLTGLPNRYRMTRDCEERIKKCRREGKTGYLLFFDLDGFKTVNDTMGHRVGDELLVLIGQALQNNPLTRDSSYRYGGDEFVLLCDGEPEGQLRQVIAYLREIFSTPWNLEGKAVNVGASIGVSSYPEDADEEPALMRAGDRAMYVSKQNGKGLVYCYNKGDIVPLETYKNGMYL